MQEEGGLSVDEAHVDAVQLIDEEPGRDTARVDVGTIVATLQAMSVGLRTSP
jgi:hypothetical protein